MELAKGGELFNYIIDRKRLNENEASYFFYQIINGMEYLHKNNIVHRDLKPENLLLTEEKIIKIIDFGLSNEYVKGGLLKTPCGSPCYAAPEMVLGKKYSGIKIDIWCTGIILYAMICGYLPFEDKKNEILFKKIVECDYEIPSFIPFNVKDMIKKLLITNPKERITIEDIKKHQFYAQGKVIFYKLQKFCLENIFDNKEVENKINEKIISELNNKLNENFNMDNIHDKKVTKNNGKLYVSYDILYNNILKDKNFIKNLIANIPKDNMVDRESKRSASITNENHSRCSSPKINININCIKKIENINFNITPIVGISSVPYSSRTIKNTIDLNSNKNENKNSLDKKKTNFVNQNNNNFPKHNISNITNNNNYNNMTIGISNNATSLKNYMNLENSEKNKSDKNNPNGKNKLNYKSIDVANSVEEKSLFSHFKDCKINFLNTNKNTTKNLYSKIKNQSNSIDILDHPEKNIFNKENKNAYINLMNLKNINVNISKKNYSLRLNTPKKKDFSNSLLNTLNIAKKSNEETKIQVYSTINKEAQLNNKENKLKVNEFKKIPNFKENLQKKLIKSIENKITNEKLFSEAKEPEKENKTIIPQAENKDIEKKSENPFEDTKLKRLRRIIKDSLGSTNYQFDFTSYNKIDSPRKRNNSNSINNIKLKNNLINFKLALGNIGKENKNLKLDIENNNYNTNKINLGKTICSSTNNTTSKPRPFSKTGKEPSSRGGANGQRDMENFYKKITDSVKQTITTNRANEKVIKYEYKSEKEKLLNNYVTLDLFNLKNNSVRKTDRSHNQSSLIKANDTTFKSINKENNNNKFVSINSSKCSEKSTSVSRSKLSALISHRK